MDERCRMLYNLGVSQLATNIKAISESAGTLHSLEFQSKVAVNRIGLQKAN
jgi:hypothetical protein